ncbi:H-NS family nucleoid-associated regulatory protein [Dichelobacter nodosus]|uniref:DNA-binding protein H-NS-like C-terminal domain-containing protein n=1 Tax=Dichelobacter nodosus (strain VCS1703A) TaxID=246195 RepID=A5EX59_DICNV|nr:H-NS histone family protein [Dichelobacter nodosus]ABQ13559.1 conserved hypothetical protein [Dichelobacter nodosus VCS1703A]AXM46053.1 H-NS histone family protein [Dichelobacter nodosus]KNZ38987.1 hypothetical protein AKG33_06460 [Dichelobacter nodosus]TGA64789.1 H-NS histone family protein [Dichelobacter nodosus]
MEKLFDYIDALSNDDFETLINYIDKERKKRAREIIAEAQRQASRFAQDIAPTVSRKTASKRPPKFANPDNPEQTWSGMGRQPDWYKAYIDKGGNEKNMLIK